MPSSIIGGVLHGWCSVLWSGNGYAMTTSMVQVLLGGRGGLRAMLDVVFPLYVHLTIKLSCCYVANNCWD